MFSDPGSMTNKVTEKEHLFLNVLSRVGRDQPANIHSTNAILTPEIKIPNSATIKGKARNLVQAGECYRSSPVKPYSSARRQEIPTSAKKAIRGNIGTHNSQRPSKFNDKKFCTPETSPSKKSREITKSDNSTPRCFPGQEIFSARKESSDRQRSGKFSTLNSQNSHRNAQSQKTELPICANSPTSIKTPEELNSRKNSKEPIASSQRGSFGTTAEYSTNSGSFIKFNDTISQEREKLIQYNKLCIFTILLLKKVYEKKRKIRLPTLTSG